MHMQFLDDSLHPENMDKVVELNRDCKVISIGIDSIWNWANKVIDEG